MPSIDTLVLDSAPLLTCPVSTLQTLAKHFVTTVSVLAEIRDEKSRIALEQWQNVEGGLRVKQPTADAMAKVTAFARKTGDISVLSTTDLQIIALLYTVEVEANGTRRIRSAPGAKTEFEMEKEHAAKLKREARLKRKAQEPVQEVQEEIKQLDLTPGQPEVEEDNDDWTTVPTKQNTKVEESDTDSSDGEWITPSNVTEHKARDTGLISAAPGAGSSSAQKMEAACITGDFAMQNVGLQMGLNIVGSNGSKIRNVKTWVLRCHACYKLCKNPTEKFCPSCGNATLLRTSITYLPAPTPEHPKGYILHLKSNFQYHNRGTIFALPSPLSTSGASKRSGQDTLILRADQKEYIKGQARYEVARRKEERQAKKEVDGRVDVDWQPVMLLGEKGRKGQSGRGPRTGRDGLPVVGMGKKNPNAVGRKIC